MPNVTEQLRRYGEAVEHYATRPSVDLRQHPVGRRSARRRSRVAAAAVVLVAGALGLIALDPSEKPFTVTTGPETTMFSVPTGVVLLFSDGLDGVLAVDLDSRVAARRAVEGERAGDQPFRLTVTRGALIVGWGEIHAVPLDGGPSRLIDTATVYVPAAEPGQVWTLDRWGGRTGDDPVTLRRVDTAGNVVFSSTTFDPGQYQPLLGVPGGLAVATSTGIAVWDAASGTITQERGVGRAFAAASNGRQLAWCTDTCHDPGTLDLAKTGGPTPPHVSGAVAPVFSPDGKHLAVIRPDGTLAVRTIETSQTTAVASGLDPLASLQWGPDGRQLFYATRSYGERSMTLGRYDVTGGWEQQLIPVGGGLGAVVLHRGDADAFFPAQLVDPSDCMGPVVFPSGRKDVCGFAF